MMKLHTNKLSQKKIDRKAQKAAFVQFVNLLQKSNDVISGKTIYWECCNIGFSSLRQLHKHISCNHEDVIDELCIKLKRPSQSEEKTLCSECTFPEVIDLFLCSCSPRDFVVILFYHYVEIDCDLNMLKTWQVKDCCIHSMYMYYVAATL